MAKIGFISLGCDKNLVDTEKMLHLLMEEGHEIVTDESIADILIVNSCAFIHDAQEESINTIIEMGEYKEADSSKFLIVCGCLGQRYKEEMFNEMPEVDAICGVHSYEKINDVIKRLQNGERRILEVSDEHVDTVKKRVITTSGHYEYVKVAEGCNHACTYCVIPKIRGKYKSRPMEDIIDEVKHLAESGVTELMLVAQEVSCYGIDIYDKKCVAELINKISEVEGIKWIRILYCYPESIDNELIDVMANNSKVCKYIDMPIQHTSDKILKLMGRKTNKAEIFEKVRLIREKVPGVVIRSTLIVGFPGETEEDFNELLEDIKELKIEKLGVFDYSREDGTPADKLPGHIEDDEKIRRKNIAVQEAECVIDRCCDKHAGKTYEVIVDGRLEEDDVYCGRTYMDMPNIDGIVFFKSENTLIAGDFVNVEIEKAVGYDLYGKEV